MPVKGEHVSATQRMEAARRSTKNAITRELLQVRILSRIWTAHRCIHPHGEPGYLPPHTSRTSSLATVGCGGTVTFCGST